MSASSVARILRWGWLTAADRAHLHIRLCCLPSLTTSRSPKAAASPGRRHSAAASRRHRWFLLPPAHPQELERQGDQLRAQKRYLDSIDYYDAAIAKQPAAILYNKQGIALLFLQRNKDAQKCFEKALSARQGLCRRP